MKSEAGNGPAQARPAPVKAVAPKVAATVARGRTVKIGPDYIGEGKIVNLPEDEVLQLRRAGFLIDPDATEIIRDTGPNYVKPETPAERRLTLA